MRHYRMRSPYYRGWRWRSAWYANRARDQRRTWRVLARHWARRTNRPYYGFRVWRVFSQEAS